MKKIILLAALFLPLGLCAQTRQAADAAYENGRFEEALKYYQDELKTAKGDNLYEAQLRIVASQYMLGKYMGAAESAFQFPLPQNPVWKARFLLYRAQTAQSVKNMYRANMPQSDEDDARLPELSQAQWNDKIDESFEALWDLRTFLINAPIEQEKLILDLQNADTKLIPTLFDFTVLKWKERLLSGSGPVVPLRAANVLTLDYKTPAQAKDDAQKLASVLAEAAKLGGRGRADARIMWQAELLTLPFNEPRFFSFENKSAQRLEAARLLEALSGYAPEKKGFLARISGALRSANADYGKAYAALQAAELLNADEEYAEAVAVCDWASENLGDNYYAQACRQFAEGIRAPLLNITPPSFSQDPADTKISFTARNVPAVHARLYPVTEAELKAWYMQQNRTLNSWGYLTAVPSKQIPQLVKRAHIASADSPMQYAKPHAFANAEIKLPALEKRGFYAVVFSYDQSFDPEQAPLQAVVLNNTDLALFASAAIEGDPADYRTRQSKTLTPNVFRVYTLNLKTGEPEADAEVTYFTDWKGNKEQGRTNENGLLTLARKIRPDGDNSYSILPKAVKNGSAALTREALYFNYYPGSPVKLYAETDRAIYRPGQKVQFAVYGFENAGRGLKTLAQGSKVSVTVRDANYEKVYEKTLTLNDYGAAKDELTLAETGLLGNYWMEATFKSGRYTANTYATFRADDYKRPEYEITLAPGSALEYGKEASVTGKAQYYFGAPLEKATVKYTVNRTYFRPPFWWWRPFNVAMSNEFIAEGETKTDKDGSFKITFTPKAGETQDFPSVFSVTATVMDASGRVIETKRDYKASQKPLFFAPSFDKGFYDAGAASPLASVKLTDVNGEPAAGKFTAEIYELENVLPKKQNGADMPFLDGGQPSLETLYGQNKETRKVSSRDFNLKKGEEAKLDIPALPEGVYKLKLQSKNADTAELVFLAADKKSNLALPAVAIAQYEKYYPGTQAKILLGAQALTGAKRIEVYDDGQFLALRELIGPGAGVYALPIQNDWRGGVYLRWFGAGDYRFYTAQTFVNVPHDNKELSLNMDVPSAVKPGQKVSWTLSAKDATGNGVDGQASVRVYDKSLDYYAKTAPAFSLSDLYPAPSSGARLTDSATYSYITGYQTDKPQKNTLLPPQMPQLNLLPRFRAYMSGGGMLRSAAAPKAMMKQAVMEESAPVYAAADNGIDAAYEMATANSADMALGMESVTRDAMEEGADVQTRTDFSETAYFNPMLPVKGGKASASFTMPQSLTAWNILAFAFTKNADFGAYSAQTVTRKDMMVRLSLPRFWREGDASTLVAQVTNLTDKKRGAEVTLDLTMDGQDAAALFGIDKASKTVTVPAKGTAAVTWPVTVPQGVGVLKAAATVRAGNDADAEARELPVLPAKERLAESVTAALESGTQTLKLENLLSEDPTRQVSNVTLRVDPSLMLSVFDAMPQLLKPRHNDALSVADRYVPLAVVNAFYKTYPMLQTAVTKLPKRNTRTPAWDNQDPARLMLLAETPWLQTAQGGAQREEFLTDLFNPAAVEKARAKAEKDLAKYQTASGGYAWMPGGEPSEYITLNLLSSYAQALRYGGEIPQEAAQKALAWLAPRIEKNLKEAQPSADTVSNALYAAYVFTAFPQKWTAVKKAPVKNWLDYADRYASFMTPLGQTYAAAAYYRLGDGTKAQNYLDIVLSQMKTDPVTGSYFAPEAQSWMWYNDTLNTQTAALRTLLEIRPESDKAAGLVKWLLFNRKAEAWQSSSATANAVYALLAYMQRHGLLDDPAEYALSWGGEKKTLHFEPFDWSEKLAWTQEAQNVAPQYYAATVTKRGGLTGFVTLDAVYTTADAKASPKGVLNVQRRYLLKYTENGREKARELQPGEEIPVGSEVEVRLDIEASSAFDFVVLTDPKPAGFESAELLSGWSWQTLSVYRENRDAATNFFISRVPAGKYTLRYTLRPTLGGAYHALPAQLQSMYAPEFSAHTDSAQLRVK